MPDEPKVASTKKGGHRGAPILDAVKVGAAIVAQRGNLSAVARKFGVSRTAVQNMVRESDALKETLSDARAGMVDAVESRFYRDCLKDEPAFQTSRIFFLKTQGKDRGYVERTEVHQKSRVVIEEEVVEGGDDPPQDTPLPEAG